MRAILKVSVARHRFRRGLGIRLVRLQPCTSSCMHLLFLDDKCVAAQQGAELAHAGSED